MKRRVSLFVSCLVDQLEPQVGLAAATVLERAGCEVEFDPRQTCCGQPAFNSGHRAEAACVARGFLDVFEGKDTIVAPSGSCAAMVKHMPELYPEGSADRERAERVAARTFELSAFLVRELEVVDLGARFEGAVTWHDACHGLRELGLSAEPRALIEHVAGARLVEMPAAESCCGFGGTFSVKHPEISVAMLDTKLDSLRGKDVDAVVSSDVSCLMQIGGRLARQGSPLRTMHLAELLAAR